MPTKINKTMCIRSGCFLESHFKRLCKDHFAQQYPGINVSEYRYSWKIVESFEGAIRAASEEEALLLVRKGIVAAQRTVFNPKPTNVELIGKTEC